MCSIASGNLASGIWFPSSFVFIMINPMNIDRDVVLNIAKLAHLELEAHEVEVFTKQLGDILHYVETLAEVKQPSEPFTMGATASPLRADETGPSLSVEEALANAPARARQFFKVPRIIP